MRRIVLTIGLVLALLCAFGVSAAATVILAREHAMTGLLPFMLVGVLELLSTACAWGWVTTTETRLKLEFALIMTVTSGVSLAAGALAFGWVGLFPSLALLADVHVTSRMWTAVAAPGRAKDSSEDGGTSRPVIEDSSTVIAPVIEDAQLVIEDSTEDGEDSSEDSSEDTGPISITASVIEDEAVIARLASWDGPLPGVGVIARELSIGKTKAARCKAEAQRRRGEVVAS